MPDDLQDWTKGDKITAAHLQQQVDALKALLGVPGATVSRQVLYHKRRQFTAILGKITDSGPNGESDYEDERYWVTPQYIDESIEAGTNDQIEMLDKPPPEIELSDATVTVTNLAELKDHTHNLEVDTQVWYFVEYDEQEFPTAHNVMAIGGTEAVGQYQYMNRTVVAQNTMGFDFLRAHSFVTPP